MRQRLYMTAMAAVVAITGASVVLAAPGLKGAKLSSQAKVTLAAARHTALAARPGVITDQELEMEKGGSGLRYSFDVRSNGKTYEVGIDAKTGTVLENAAEGSNPD